MLRWLGWDRSGFAVQDRNKSQLEAGLVFVLAAVCFGARVSGYAPLHEWNLRLAGLAGNSFYRGLTDPIWSLLVDVLLALGARPLAGWVAALSVLCAAAALALAFATVRRIPFAFERNAWRSDAGEADVRRFAAWTAAATLAAAPPIWVAATQPTPFAMDLLVVCALARLWVSVWASHRARKRHLFSAIFGAALWEHPALALAAPLVALGLILHTARARLPWRAVAADLALAALAFAGVGALWGARLWFLPLREWSGLETPAALAQSLVLETWRSARSAWPRTGWIAVGLLYGAPLVIMLQRAVLPVNRMERLMAASLLAIGAGVVAIALTGLPGSPWHLTGARPLLLAPYLALAFWWSRLCAGWIWARAVQRRRPFPRGSYAIPLLLLGALAAHLPFSAPAASQRAAGRVVAHIAQTAAARDIWLVGARLDPALRLAAWDLRLRPLIINTALAESPVQQRQIAAAFPDAASRALLELGLPALLYHQLRDAAFARRVAVFDVPSYWGAQLAVRAVPDAGWSRWFAEEAADETPNGARVAGFWSQLPDARDWVAAGEPFRAGGVALAAYLRELARASGEDTLAAHLDLPPARERFGQPRAPLRTTASESPAQALRDCKAAEAAMAHGQIAAARATFERLARRPSALAQRALEHLMLLDFLEGKWGEADRHTRALAALAPGHPLLYWMRGHALYRQGRVEEAERSIRLSLAVAETPLAHHALAVLLSDRREWTNAILHADRAVALAPGHPVFLATRGTAHAFLGHSAAARADFEAALRAGGGAVPAIRLNTAALRLAAGDRAGARAMLEGLARESLAVEDRAQFDELTARLAEGR